MNNDRSGFRGLLYNLFQTHDAYKVVSGFASLTACALAYKTREAEYLEEAKHWKKEEMEVFAQALDLMIEEMQAKPFTDILGPFYTDAALSHKSQQWGGVYHTPPEICELMTAMVVGAPPSSGPITLCEPACGGGAMILAFAKTLPKEDVRRLRVTAIDISKVACDMTYINTTLWGIPAEVIHGNSLSLKFWAAWRNVHWTMDTSLFLAANALPQGGGHLHPSRETNEANQPDTRGHIERKNLTRTRRTA